MKRLKRVLVSVVMGAGLPVVYILLLMLVGKILRSFDVGYRHWFEYLSFPITWVGDIYTYFFLPKDHPGLIYLGRYLWLATIIGDLILYTLLAYVYLKWRDASRLKRKIPPGES
jgi:hypothetical protein